ncbi:MAG: MlaD family protein, partial [Deferrisomatales bacterium]
LDDVAGLAVKGEVLVAGISVGTVEAIGLEDGRARLVLRLHSGVQLPADSSASLRTHGVLGEKYVAIQPGRSPQPLKEGDLLRPGPPPGDLDQLVNRFNDISADVKRVTERLANVFGTPEGEAKLDELLTGLRDTAVGLRGAVDENREALRATLADLRALSAQLLALVSANRAGIDDVVAQSRDFTRTLAEATPAIARNLETLTRDTGEVIAENRQDLRQSVSSLRDAAGRLSATLEAVQDLVAAAGSREGTLGRLLHDDSLYQDLQGTLAGLREVTDRLNRGEGTLGKLLTDDSAYTELSGSLRSLRSVSDKIDRGDGTLGRLINDQSVHTNLNDTLKGIGEFVTGANRFQFELGYRGEYLTGLGEAKNYFGVEIRPRQDRFYYLALVDDPRGDVETEITERTVTGAAGPTTVKEEETVTRDRLKFSAQVGKRFSFLTLRGGVFESTGGVAADVDLWADRLRLTAEAFDLGRDPGPPHLKLAVRWTFLKHLYVTAGLDDFIDNRGRADYFLGGGIRFLDDDIKYLLSPAAGAVR